jgi:hypothetical protein
MAPKETAALVKSMSGATGKISAAPIPVNGRTIDVPAAPNQVVDISTLSSARKTPKR